MCLTGNNCAGYPVYTMDVVLSKKMHQLSLTVDKGKRGLEMFAVSIAGEAHQQMESTPCHPRECAILCSAADRGGKGVACPSVHQTRDTLFAPVTLFSAREKERVSLMSYSFLAEKSILSPDERQQGAYFIDRLVNIASCFIVLGVELAF